MNESLDWQGFQSFAKELVYENGRISGQCYVHHTWQVLNLAGVIAFSGNRIGFKSMVASLLQRIEPCL